jgi:predicted Zn-dependent protease
MTLETPIVRNREISRAERPTGAPQTDVPGADLSASRPMVSETAAHPERARRRTPANGFREEDLIARIAADPKDFTAYESLGDYYLETDNVKDAKECYRQVLRLSPVQRMVKIKIRRLEKLLSQKTGGETE